MAGLEHNVWVRSILDVVGYPQLCLDIGSRDINGSPRSLFAEGRYVGLDVVPGRNVDVVADGATWVPDRPVDMITCIGVFEHTPAPIAQAICANMFDMLQPGGWAIIQAENECLPHSGIDGWAALHDGEHYATVSAEQLNRWLERFTPNVMVVEGHQLFAVARKGETVDAVRTLMLAKQDAHHHEQMMIANREKLIAWQSQKWFAHPGNRQRRLHLMSGNVHLGDYINIDTSGDKADTHCDVTNLPYSPGSTDEIICQHGLEHIPQRLIKPTLEKWFKILAPGGTVELGLPDVELCMKRFLETPEPDRWGWPIYTILGWQISDQVLRPVGDEPFELGQVHMGGLSLGRLISLLKDIGYEILESYNYDGYSSPSAFVYARKPLDGGEMYEQDVVLGVFTHRTTYLPAYLDSVKQHLPQIPLIVKVHDGLINVNMEMLRQDFIATGKRFWIFTDDDIQFLHRDTVKDAVKALIRNKWGACHVYSTFDPNWINDGYHVENLQERETTYAAGYFILVDSLLVGDVQPDLSLPDGNTSVDTSYSMSIRAKGYKIGIAPHVVYHLKKDVISYPAIAEATNRYLFEKWGQFYFDWARYDNNVIDPMWQK